MKLKRFLIALLLLLVVIPKSNIQADEVSGERKRPTYIKAQYAGNMGLISVGVGKVLFDKHVSIDLNYGYLPRDVNGVRVHTIALRPAVHFKGYPLWGQGTSIYLGTSITYGIANNTYVNYPSYYSDDYYSSNAIHTNPMVGTRLGIPVKSKVINSASVFAEFGALDDKLIDALSNSIISITRAWSFSFGVAFTLE